jgi:integrase
VRVLAPDEIKRFLAAARDERLGALYLVAMTSALRQGELLGLMWADVDWGAGTLQIRRKVGRTKAHGLAFGDLKSKKGRRTILLPAPVMEELRQHREAQRAERERMGDAWENLDLIFPDERGKPVEAQNLVRRSYEPLLRRAGLPAIRFHDQRHSAATLLLSMGVHMKVMQEQLGHANIKMTMDLYAHASESMQRDAADKLARFLDDGTDRAEETDAAE